MTHPLPVDPNPHDAVAYERLLTLRTQLIGYGLNPITATPTDLQRIGLHPWPHQLFGITCVPSPILAL